MSNYRGMAGALRQAVEDAGLEKKVYGGHLYNDKQPNNKRRFNWEYGVKKELTKAEIERFYKHANANLEAHGLKLDDDGYFGGSIILTARPTEDGKIKTLKEEAKKLGYQLVKIK